MKIISSIKELKIQIYLLKKKGKSIGFVPTMGALHSGHISLIKKSNEINDITICSIFINPTQFDSIEDFEKYPSTLNDDIAKLKGEECDIVFSPNSSEMFISDSVLIFNFGNLETVMEGAHRLGHFNGVALIVSKLFNLVKPDTAFFGQKDYQQLAIIKQLVIDLSFDIEIYSCPTFREKSGLAMSSRNKRLSENELKEAPKIYQSLKLAEELISQKESISNVKARIESFYKNSKLELVYFEISDAKTLQSIEEKVLNQKIVICVAAFLGKVRLIDNIIL